MALGACGETTISIEDPERGPDLDLGLLAYLRLDEATAGDQAFDSSGHGHDGSPSADPPVPSSSVPPVGFTDPRSLSFDGLAQLVDLGGPATLDVAGNVTLSAWIRPRALNGYRNVIAHGFRWSPNGDLSLRIYAGDYEFTAWDSVDHMASAAVPEGDVNTWHHIAGVYDGESYRLYRDGELLAEHADTFTPMQFDAPWAIGGRSATDPSEGRYFDGFIDDVRIYARALSADEVRALFRR